MNPVPPSDGSHSYPLRPPARKYPEGSLGSLGLPAAVLSHLTDAAKKVSPQQLHLYKQGKTTISALGLTIEDLRSIQDVLSEKTVWGSPTGVHSLGNVSCCCCCCCTGCCSCAAIQEEA